VRHVRAFLLACAALLAVAPALAVSPADQYKTFGRDEGIIIDQKTTLLWQRSNSPQPLQWTDAKAYCATLTIVSDNTTYSGFRLPTYKELLTIVDENPSFEEEKGVFTAKAIDANAFPNTPPTSFWSSTPNAANPANSAWSVDFGSGVSNPEAVLFGLFVRCVKQ